MARCAHLGVEAVGLAEQTLAGGVVAAQAGRLAIRGRAPDGLVYTLGAGRFGAGDVFL
jgi:hypothetical protein